ncbi:DNA-3-methyladenine glycosylase 2 family protein, partial [Streptomyces sp. SID335]
TPAAGIPLRLAHRGPYRADAVFDLLAAEAVTGIEEVTGERGARTYRRTLRLPVGTGIVAVEETHHDATTGTGAGSSGEALHRGGWLDARLHLTDLRDLTTAVRRLRRLFDLDADPYA